MNELEPIDSELSALLELAKPNDAVPADARARLDARMLAVVAGGAGLGAGAGAAHAAKLGAGGALVRALWPAVASFVVGGLVGAAVMRASFAPPPRVVYVDRPVAALAPSAPTVPIVPELQPEPARAAAPSLTPTAPAPVAARVDSVAAERALLDGARLALERGDGEAALAAAEKHARTFPRGALVQEREAIAVRALVLLGRTDDARTRAARFVAHFPDSLLRPAVEAAVANP